MTAVDGHQLGVLDGWEFEATKYIVKITCNVLFREDCSQP
jgi:hypothetical protein